MPLIDYVSMNEATGFVREVVESDRYEKYSPYAEIRLNNPHVPKAMREYDKALFEFIMVAVTQSNECEFCAGSHRENLVTLLDMDDKTVLALSEDDYSVLDEEQLAVVEFARKAALDSHRVGPLTCRRPVRCRLRGFRHHPVAHDRQYV